MSVSDGRTAARNRGWQIAILVFDFGILLAPPLHWWLGNGNAATAEGYFLISNAVVVLSLFVLWRLARAEHGGDDE